jgi:hypothetical protein
MATYQPADYVSSNTAQSVQKPRRFQFLAMDARDPLEGPLFVIPGLVAQGAVTVLTGKWGSRKSFVAIDWCARVAAGLDINGTPVLPGSALYLAGEGQGSLARRMHAWLLKHGANGAALPFRYSEAVPNFRSAEDVTALLEAIKDLAEEFPANAPLQLVVIDTLSKALAGGSDTETKDLGPALRSLERIRDHFPGCAVLVLHHPPRGDEIRARGLGALEADTDAQLILEWNEAAQIGRISATKQKDGDTDAVLCFRTEALEIGPHKHDGSPVTSLVVGYLDGGTIGPKAKAERAWPATLRLFKDCLLEARTFPHRIVAGPEVQAVEVEDIRPIFYARYPTNDDDAAKAAENRKKALKRAVRQAADRKLIASEVIEGREIVWLTR